MTRLFYEKMLMDKFPNLQWVRVCTSAPYTVTVYACDANLDLDEHMSSQIQQFLSEMGMASCVHKVKHYFELQNDEVFPIGQIYDCVKNVALKGAVNRAGIQSALKATFPIIDPERFEVNGSVVTFHLRKEERWTSYSEAVYRTNACGDFASRPDRKIGHWLTRTLNLRLRPLSLDQVEFVIGRHLSTAYVRVLSCPLHKPSR